MAGNSPAVQLTRSVVGMHAPSLAGAALTADASLRAVWQAHNPHAWAQGLSLLPLKYVAQGAQAPTHARVIALTNPNATLLHTQDTLVAHVKGDDVVFVTLDDMDPDTVLLAHVHSMGAMAAVPASMGMHHVPDAPTAYLAATPDHKVRLGAAADAVRVNVDKRVPVYPTQLANPKMVDHRLDTPAGKHSGTLALTSIVIVVVALGMSLHSVM